MARPVRDPDAERRINEHLEAVDRALATRGLPLSERRSVTDDVEAQIRDMLAERAGGAPTTLDVEAVLSALDTPESYAEGARGTTSTSAQPPRLCRLAVLGAVWAPCLVFLALALLGVRVVHVDAQGRVPGPTWWQLGARFTLLPLGLLAPFGTTILGWVAVGRIRRSEGRLFGLGLALLDGLLFPLLVLDVLLYLFWRVVVAIAISIGPLGFWEALGRPTYSLADRNWSLLFVLAAATSLLIDWLIVRWAWRRLRVPDGR